MSAGKNSTLSHLYLNNIFICYLLEDRMAEKKEAGFTCIPEGQYILGLNTTAGMNRKYRERFPRMHKGMLQITGITGFGLVFLHIGNTHNDTRGCPLTGHYWEQSGDDYKVCQSGFAYQQLYAQLLALVQKEVIKVRVTNYTKIYGN